MTGDDRHRPPGSPRSGRHRRRRAARPRYLTPQRQITINYPRPPTTPMRPAGRRRTSTPHHGRVPGWPVRSPSCCRKPAERATLLTRTQGCRPPPRVADPPRQRPARAGRADDRSAAGFGAAGHFNAGSAHDPAGKPGVASMTAALLTQGARRPGRAEIITTIPSSNWAPAVGAGAGADFTNVYANAPKDVFSRTRLMADLICAIRPSPPRNWASAGRRWTACAWR